MHTIFSVFLVIHIVAGGIGLLTGALNIIRKKGDKGHERAGIIFTYAMLTAGAAALVLSRLHPNDFLFIVGIFTIYMVGTGRRYIRFKNRHPEQPAGFTDWALSIGMMAGSALFIFLGVRLLIQGNSFGAVPVVFAGIGLLFAVTDIRYYRAINKPKGRWLTAHLQRMTGGFIAALTAFLVVNSKYLLPQIPSLVYWLLPTALLVPVIFRWSRRYGPKKKTGAGTAG